MCLTVGRYGSGLNILEAWNKAYSADPVSIFGGIIVANQEITKEVAQKISEVFLEIIIAPSYQKEAMDILIEKKNIRIMTLAMNKTIKNYQKIVSVMDGLLIQDTDNEKINKNDWKTVTEMSPTESELEDLLFAWKVVKHVKSNAIVIAKNGQTIGIGAGQMNRIGAAEIAFTQARTLSKNAVLASDAFFPMPDVAKLSAEYGIKAIVQPGGSIKDNLSIKECNKHGIIMIFTDMRHFKH